jgi:hypothetical protein
VSDDACVARGDGMSGLDVTHHLQGGSGQDASIAFRRPSSSRILANWKPCTRPGPVGDLAVVADLLEGLDRCRLPLQVLGQVPRSILRIFGHGQQAAGHVSYRRRCMQLLLGWQPEQPFVHLQADASLGVEPLGLERQIHSMPSEIAHVQQDRASPDLCTLHALCEFECHVDIQIPQAGIRVELQDADGSIHGIGVTFDCQAVFAHLRE